MKKSEHKVYTVEDYLLGSVKFKLPASAVMPIFINRGIDAHMPVSELGDEDKTTLRLCYADLLKWFVIGPSKVNNVSDSDNGWTHSGGGYELSDDDIANMKAEANAIYSELEPESVFARKSSFKVSSFGVMRANRDMRGMPLPHIVK